MFCSHQQDPHKLSKSKDTLMICNRTCRAKWINKFENSLNQERANV